MTAKERAFQIAAHGVLCLLAMFCLLPFLLLLSLFILRRRIILPV